MSQVFRPHGSKLIDYRVGRVIVEMRGVDTVVSRTPVFSSWLIIWQVSR